MQPGPVPSQTTPCEVERLDLKTLSAVVCDDDSASQCVEVNTLHLLNPVDAGCGLDTYDIPCCHGGVAPVRFAPTSPLHQPTALSRAPARLGHPRNDRRGNLFGWGRCDPAAAGERTTARSPWFHEIVRLGMLLACGLWLAGCAGPTSTPVETPVPPAHLVVLNQTDYSWHIVITPASGKPAIDNHLQPRTSLTVDLAGGDYMIEQTVLSAGAGGELTRKLPASLKSGETYRWRLVTLLSDPEGHSGAH